MNLYEILGILFIHWFADFVIQTDKQAKGKSTNWFDLLEHTVNYSFVWLLIGMCVSFPFFKGEYELINIVNVLIFVFITFICHTITDYITSRETSKLYNAGKIHNFFVLIGFDQWIHYVQLFITYWWIKTL